MASLLEDLTAMLVANSIGTADGVDLFRDYLPDVPYNAVVLTEYAGLPTHEGIEALVRSVQIQVRDESPTAARIKCWQIFNLLDRPLDRIVDITATRWGIVSARQSPFKLRVDQNGHTIYAFNVGITTHTD